MTLVPALTAVDHLGGTKPGFSALLMHLVSHDRGFLTVERYCRIGSGHRGVVEALVSLYAGGTLWTVVMVVSSTANIA
jgi:hypothetical protein